jgi:cytochrome c-type biogenesis protein
VLTTILTSFSIGLLASASPCVLPLYPGFLAYLSGGQTEQQGQKSRYFSGLFVLFGVLSMMLILGALIAWMAVSIGSALAWFIPLATLGIITLGVMLIFNVNPFQSLPRISSPVFKNPLLNAYLYGMLYGPLTLPCSGPLVVSIFAYSFTAIEVVDKLVVFFSFGMGFGLPLFILSLLTGATQRELTRFFALHTRTVNLAGGILLISVGVFNLITNWSMLAAFWKFGS